MDLVWFVIMKYMKVVTAISGCDIVQMSRAYLVVSLISSVCKAFCRFLSIVVMFF